MIRIVAALGTLLAAGALAAGQRDVLTFGLLAAGVIAMAILAVRAVGDRRHGPAMTDGRTYDAGEPLPAHARRPGDRRPAKGGDVITLGGADGRAGGELGAGADGGGDAGLQ